MRPNLINIDKQKNSFIFSCISEVDDIMSGIIMKFDLELKSNKLTLSDNNERVIKYFFGEKSSYYKTKADNI